MEMGQRSFDRHMSEKKVERHGVSDLAGHMQLKICWKLWRYSHFRFNTDEVYRSIEFKPDM